MSVNQVHQFLSKENIQVLWDVLIEYPIVKQFCSSHDKILELTKIYEKNLKGFYDIERKNCADLIELNKKYILLIINYLNTQFNTNNTLKQHTQHQLQNQQQSSFKKITITDEQIKQPITYEEIQNERKTQLEKDFYNRQQEFNNAMSQDVPPVPDFSDKIDQPISEIELEIKKIQEQRNYDIELINKNFQNNNISNEFIEKNFIKNKNDKHISWADNEDKNNTPNNNNNFLNKLKKTDQNISDEITFLKNEIMSLNNKLNLFIEKIENFEKKK